MTRHINPAGLKIIKDFETLRLRAYDDMRPNHNLQPNDEIIGTLTIGYGHTGKDVLAGWVITEAEANELLRKDVSWAENIANSFLSDLAINENEFSALVSLIFNTGRAPATLISYLKRGDHARAAKEFDRWVFSKGKRLKGLERRRNAEQALFVTPVTP